LTRNHVQLPPLLLFSRVIDEAVLAPEVPDEEEELGFFL
jgi:hypothetical protein